MDTRSNLCSGPEQEGGSPAQEGGLSAQDEERFGRCGSVGGVVIADAWPVDGLSGSFVKVVSFAFVSSDSTVVRGGGWVCWRS